MYPGLIQATMLNLRHGIEHGMVIQKYAYMSSLNIDFLFLLSKQCIY